MAFTSVITVDFTGTSHGTSDTFTVLAISNNESDTGVSYTDLENGYTFQYSELELTGFTVTAEDGACIGQPVGTVNIATPTPTPTATAGVDPTETATPTPTPTSGEPQATETATPTPTPEPQQLNFFIQSQEYSSPEQACDGDLPGTSVFVTASVISFENFVNNLNTFTTGEKTIYLDNGLTPGNEFGGTGLFHLADSDGVGAGTHALRVSSGVVDLSQPCTTSPPTATPIPYIFYELRADLPDGTGWLTSNDACTDGSPTSFGSIFIDQAELPVTVGNTFYTNSSGPGTEFDGGDRYFIKGDGTEAYRIGSTGIVAEVVSCS